MTIYASQKEFRVNVPPPPLAPAEWREFLRSYSSEFLESPFLREMAEEGRDDLFASETERANRWLGYEPATEDAIAAAERRLGIRLPPSYRNFLLVSNGWHTISYAVDLLDLTEIGWFADLEPRLMEAWSDSGAYDDWIEVLKRSVLISNDDGGSGHYLFLHADSVADNGEWTAYEWWPGDGDDPEPHADFATMVTSLWEDEKRYRAADR
ncbi:SMI1/KNR4 family protein [Amycolatopsis sp. NPDC059027]|uniref:SMI1/KNR4 family protein n=1 Tax=unclassified Amycolatopsis TaxID=2618356 RepID=UPI00366F519C